MTRCSTDGCWCRSAARADPGTAAARAPPAIEPPRYDPKCYLCPGNVRANGARNPDYPGTFVFTNDFAALQPGQPGRSRRQDGLLVAEGERGTSRVRLLLAPP